MFLVIATLIGVHELGHYLAARRFKVPISVFAIGFWPFVVRVRRGSTEWRLGLFLLGGYISPDEEVMAQRTPLQRFIIVAAGPFFSVVAGLLLLTAMELSVDVAWGRSNLEVGAVKRSSFAERMGCEPGDRPFSINDWEIRSWDHVGQYIEDAVYGGEMPARDAQGRLINDANGKLTMASFPPSTNLILRVDRRGAPVALDGTALIPEIVAYFGERPRVRVLMIRCGEFGFLPNGLELSRYDLPFFDRMRWESVKGIWTLRWFGDWLYSGSWYSVSLSEPGAIGGNVGVLLCLYHSSKVGALWLMKTWAMFSILLGLSNLIPILPFDGGRMLDEILAMMGRDPAPDDEHPADAGTKSAGIVSRTRKLVTTGSMAIGLTLIAILLIVSLYADVTAVFTWRFN